MNIQLSNKNVVLISRTATIIIFLALIRCIAEPFRLNHYTTSPVIFEKFSPFLEGALTTTIALLIMTIFSFYGKSRVIIVISILTIILLLIEKIYVSYSGVCTKNISNSLIYQLA